LIKPINKFSHIKIFSMPLHFPLNHRAGGGVESSCCMASKAVAYAVRFGYSPVDIECWPSGPRHQLCDQ
jgi:hypothetical protein